MGAVSQVKSAAVYTRISLDNDGTGAGVERQRQDCLALAEQLGWPVGEVYEDNDISAYSGKRRPEYLRMIGDLETGQRDAVIVYHLDRLTRRPLELEQFLAVIDRAGVRHVRFVTGHADIGTSDGLLIIRILSAVAASESGTKSRRVTRKMLDNAQKGLPHGTGNRPYGYEADAITIRPGEADVIRQMAARYLAGESVFSLTRWLQAEGIKSATGKEWRSEQLSTVLHSGRIAGIREYKTEAEFERGVARDHHP
jgi:site-specific DNA recombinase